MKKYLVSVMALLALTGLALFAADIDGTWTAETQGKNGPQTTTLTLTSKAGVLTGKFEGGRGGPADLADGKIDGANVSFKIVTEGKNGKQEREYKGTLKDGALTLSTTTGRGPQELNFKKK